MPHFCKCGSDEYICQICGRIRCSREQPSIWGKIPLKDYEGNICPDCQKKSGMQQGATVLAMDLFGMTKEDAIQKKICVKCKKKVGLFDDQASAREYQITGFCQKCQDELYELFKKEE